MKLLVPIYSHSSVQIQHDTTACFFSRTHLLKFQSFFPNSQVNAKSDTLAQGATAYSSQEIIYIKRLVSLSFSLLLSSDSFRLNKGFDFCSSFSSPDQSHLYCSRWGIQCQFNEGLVWKFFCQTSYDKTCLRGAFGKFGQAWLGGEIKVSVEVINRVRFKERSWERRKSWDREGKARTMVVNRIFYRPMTNKEWKRKE